MDIKKALCRYPSLANIYEEMECMVDDINAANGEKTDKQKLLKQINQLRGLLINIAVFLKNSEARKKLQP